MTQTSPGTADVSPRRLSYQEFLEGTGENSHVEWENGEVIPLPPVSGEHSDTGSFLLALFRLYCDNKRNGRVHYEPFQMKTGPDLPGRSPDLMFIASENLPRLMPTYLDGPADLVVEIVSPESRERDRGTKFYEYEQGGVREYWLLDPMRKQAEFYRIGEDGYYHLIPVGEDRIYHSQVMPGLWIVTDWLWLHPKPALLDILKQWGII